MTNLSKNDKPDPKLQIAFPRSSEDHRFQLVAINGSIFAILHSPLESLGPIRLHCEGWSLILLAPVKSKTNILVSAINVICLSEIGSEEGNVNIHASNRLVKFALSFGPPEKVCEMGERGEFQLEDDPGTFLYYYRLFDQIVSNIRKASTDSVADAQQKFILSLCGLADKIEKKSDNLTLPKVLDVWGVAPYPNS